MGAFVLQHEVRRLSAVRAVVIARVGRSRIDGEKRQFAGIDRRQAPHMMRITGPITPAGLAPRVGVGHSAKSPLHAPSVGRSDGCGRLSERAGGMTSPAGARHG